MIPYHRVEIQFNHLNLSGSNLYYNHFPRKPKKKSRNIQYWINQVSQLRLLNFEKRLKRKDLVSKSINDQNPNFLLEMDD
jgi:hypothetical protein